MGEHLTDIKFYPHKAHDTPVAQHFHQHRPMFRPFTVHIIGYVSGHPDSDLCKRLRLDLENYWINQLQTRSPLGMNVD